MIEVDPRFKDSGKATRKRRQKRQAMRLGLPILGGTLALGLIVGVVVMLFGGGDEDDGVSVAEETPVATGEEGEEVFVQSAATADVQVELAAAASDVFLDIRGEPMIITLPDAGGGEGSRRIVLGTQIDAQRARIGTEVRVIDTSLVDTGSAVQLTLPSSSADLATFQARRATALADPAPAQAEVTEVAQGDLVTVDGDDGSWGEVIGEGGGGQVSYVETAIGNITTQVEAVRSDTRQALFKERVLRGREGASLADLLGDTLSEGEVMRLTNFLEGEAARLGLAPEALLKPEVDAVVAIRTLPGRFEANLLQMSLYSKETFLTSLAQPRAGRFESAANPWGQADLLRRVSAEQRNLREQGDVRLKDALYSAALSAGLPSELVGELLVMFSRSQDLDRIAGRNDRLRVLYAPENGARSPAGQILFAALEGADLDFRCYVLRPDDTISPYGCYGADRRGGGGPGNGFLVPVAGTKTSGFGPRSDPILDKVVNHNGVDWGAPTGTPVNATAAGRVTQRAPIGAYGNVIYIEHPGGIESRYAHLDGFAEGIEVGDQVRGGQLIGYVGTTGRSTGPHLHFEIRVNGNPVDPLSFGFGGGASGAVEALVAQIIRVESAGNARAKNTRSTATGLGQFIESTWLRMMRTYRPDLVGTLSREELLELRFDPALSRAMVTNLARENESFLRARGHAITPGRLYLAHFLGPQGADVALRADPAATVLDTMGAAVVNANPFLKGRDVAWMTNWSDRKMSRVSGGTVAAAPPQPAPVPAAVKAYQDGINEVLSAL
ncbi:MAG: M23 family metallopeptidase [Pseudomonadota bacterium]